MKKNYLNEEKYQNTKRKISIFGFLFVFLGLAVGVFLIFTGITKIAAVKEKYSDENVQKEIIRLTEEVSVEEKKLLTTRKELIIEIQPTLDKIKDLETKRDAFEANTTEYNNYDFEIKELSLDISSKQDDIENIERYLNGGSCANEGAMKKLYKIKEDIKNYENGHYEFFMEREASKNAIYIVPGVMLCFIMLPLLINLIIITKRREIMAFSAQQVMPIAEEGIEKMVPKVGKTAKEIAKGIKEGLEDDK